MHKLPHSSREHNNAIIIQILTMTNDETNQLLDSRFYYLYTRARVRSARTARSAKNIHVRRTRIIYEYTFCVYNIRVSVRFKHDNVYNTI